MAVYEYVAMNKEGKTVRGDYDAQNRTEVVDFLHEKQLVVVHIDEKVGFSFKDISSFQIGGIPLPSKVVFAKQFATMISAGLPLIQALDVLASQEKNPAFKKALDAVTKSVEGGNKLSQAFEKHKVFSEVELNLIAAGEESGNLVEIMQRVAENLEKQKDFQSKVKGAMIYPAIIMIVMVVVVILLMMFMIPAVSDLYDDFDAELPWMTQLLVTISNFFASFWWAVVAFFIASVFGIRYYYSTPSGREVIDRILLTIPIIGTLNTKVQLAEFSRLLALLLKSGVSIISAINIVANALSNIHFKNALKTAAKEVEKGTPLAVPISRNDDFPLVVSHMIATGENTGNLDKVLSDVANYYQTEVDYMTTNLTKTLEPIILVVVGGMVAFLAFAIYGPIYSLVSLIA
ncbi:MAG: type II secretion system F family protein [Candidatus Dojkabacteria bacterium]|jgi:type IV pilus assembly protein PilC|nr:type II secretion system F family protein [Candidatus Dojkabacteria bacterium]